MSTGTSIFTDLEHHFFHGTMVTKLIIVNVGIFLVQGILYLALWSLNALDLFDFGLRKMSVLADIHQLVLQPWSLVSYMFLHSSKGIYHILFNMLFLHWFGRIFLTYLDNKKILPIYLMGGWAGAAVYLLAYNLFPVFQNEVASSYMLGSSAAVYAIMIATVALAPNHKVRLILIGDVAIKYIALFLIVMDLISAPNGNAGGHIAHLGGALFGFLYMQQLQNGKDWGKPINRFLDSINVYWEEFVEGMRNKRYRGMHKVVHKDKKKRSSSTSSVKDKQAKVDDILDKIAQSGYDSLSAEEKTFLFRYSKEK